MNKQHNIDQLFANKLENAGIKPTDNAWSKLETELAGKKKSRAATWMKVAAAILILIVAAISLTMLQSGERSGTQFASVSVDMRNAPYPKLPQETNTQLDAVMTLADNYRTEAQSEKNNLKGMQPKSNSYHLPHNSNNKMMQTLALQETTDKNQQNKKQLPASVPADLLTQEVVALHQNVHDKVAILESVKAKKLVDETDLTMAIAENNAALPMVTITYKGQPEDLEKKKFSFKNVLNSAKKLAKGDLIADLREAKDDLIQTAFKPADD
ncbi:MAG: hypothetical protein WBA74_12590 [Cyclobacteriaceae bacterium]